MRRKTTSTNKTLSSTRVFSSKVLVRSTSKSTRKVADYSKTVAKKTSAKRLAANRKKTLQSQNSQGGIKGIGRIILILAVAAFGYNYVGKSEYFSSLKKRWDKGYKASEKIIENKTVKKEEVKKEIVKKNVEEKDNTLKEKQEEMIINSGEPVALIVVGDVYTVDIDGVVEKLNNETWVDLPIIKSAFKRRILPGRKYENLKDILSFVEVIKTDRPDIYMNISEVWDFGTNIGLRFRDCSFSIKVPLSADGNLIEEIGIMRGLLPHNQKGLVDMSYNKMAILKEEVKWEVE